MICDIVTTAHIITKIDGTTTGVAEDLDLVMLMYNCNTVRVILTRQAVYGFIQRMKQLILMLILRIMLLSDLLSIELSY